MDSPPAPVPSPSSSVAARRWLTGIVLASFVFYLVFLALNMGAYGGGSDSSGYLNNARLVAQATTHMPQRVVPGFDLTQVDAFVFIPLGFRPVGSDRMAPTYPIGLPLAIAATAQITGWDAAPHFTMGVFAVLGLIFTAVLGRSAGLPWSWSWFGTLILAACPLYTFLAVQLMSDVPATVLTIMTVVGAWRSRQHTAWASLAGLAMAAGVLTRPSHLVVLLPAAVGLGLSWRRWCLFLLGGLPGAILQCLYNWHAYGHPLESGYGGPGGLFSLKIIPATLRNYAEWLPVLLTPVGVLALILPWTKRREPFAWLLILWITAVLGFYLSYYHTHETWWYLRFVLPAFPACIVGGLWIIRSWWLKRASARNFSPLLLHASPLVLAAVVIAQGVFWNLHLDASTIGRGEAKYRKTVKWASDHLPANATIAAMQCSGALVYYSDFTFVRWDILSPEQSARLAQASLATGRPLYAVLWPFEVKDATEVHMPGRWTQVGSVGDATVWKWAPPST